MKSIEKLIIKFFYRPKQFWDNWADDFVKDEWQVKTHAQHKWLLSKIKKSKPESILEVGCGFGRNINFLRENGIDCQIDGFDISERMIRLANKRLAKKKTKLFVSSLSDFPTDKKYDLVFTHGVLMHIKPSGVIEAINNLLYLSSKYIILIEQNYGGNKYTFKHRYKKYLNKKLFNVLEYKSDKKLGLDLIYVEIRNK